MEAGFDYRAEFDAGLDLILDGIDRTLSPRPSATGGAAARSTFRSSAS
jgi:hypothetical protein